jgi:hypothetical protein
MASGLKRRNSNRANRYMSFEKLRHIFAVTPDELSQIPQLRPKSKPLPQRTHQKVKYAIHRLIAEHGVLPCAADLLFLLTSKGLKTSLASIYRYLGEMGLVKRMSKTSILKISARKSKSKSTVLTQELRKTGLAHGFEVLTGGTEKPRKIGGL